MRSEMSKFIIFAAFAVGASLGLTAGIDTLKPARIRAKARLREALHSAEDRVSDPKVLDCVEALAIYNPTDAPAKSDALLGDWYQINAPEFPGDRGVDEEGNRLYTLGQGTFGVFEPKELVCAMGKARNPFVRRKDSSGVVDYTVEIPISFKDAEGRPASGTLVNEAQCEVISDDRLGVKFTGGYLCPDGEDCEVWNSTFEAAFANYKPRKRDRLMNWLLKRMMGLQKPTGMSTDGSMTYKMTKSPHGHLDVLFLDDELRITRGNRGSVVIAERVRDAVAA